MKKAIILIMLLLLCGCSLMPTEEEIIEPPKIQQYNAPEKQYYILTRNDIVSKKTVYTYFMPLVYEIHSFNFNGEVVDLHNHRLGDYVKKDEILATIDIEETNNEINQFTKELDLIYIKKEMVMQQYHEELSSAENYATVPSLSEYSDHALLMLEEEKLMYNLDYLYRQKEKKTTLAGFDGIITYISDIGEIRNYEQNTPILKLVDSSLYMFKITEADQKYFTLGNEYSMKIDNEYYDCVIVSSDELEKEDIDAGIWFARVYDFDPLWAEKTSGTIELILQEANNALFVPQNSITVENNINYVSVLENEVDVKQEVEIGETINGYTEIVKGLEEGDMVLIK